MSRARRVALVTGCSSGIGLETVIELARRDWTVHASMRNVAKRVSLDAAALDAGVDDRVNVLPLDVTDPDSARSAVAAVLEQSGRIDAVVHNAGVASLGFFEDLPEAECERVVRTNVFGVWNLTRTVLPVMRSQRSGHHVVITSDAGFSGAPMASVYVASKWALEGWAEALALELMPFGVKVTLLEPGNHRTEMIDNTPWHVPAASPYAGLAGPVRSRFEKSMRTSGRSPRAVATAVARNLEASRPRFRTPVGVDAWTSRVLAGALPWSLRRRAIGHVVGMGRTADVQGPSEAAASR